MATLNYITLAFPQALLARNTELIQTCAAFNIYRYTLTPGVIFRIPHKLKEDDVCHFFIEHEVNLSNTLRTGTLTMKVQVTVVPCHMGLFSGFKRLAGSYETNYHDEDEYSWGDDRFVPDYESAENVRKVVPLPVNIKSNLYDYLNEILFNKVEDTDIVSKYAVQLGCQAKTLQKKVVFVPVPENTGTGRNARIANTYTQHLFESAKEANIALIPEKSTQKQIDF